MALAELQAARFSCRGFQTRQVPRAVLGRVLEMAQLTASWCNAQPWQIYVTSGAATEQFREALVSCATQKGYGISPEARRSAERTPDFPMPGEYEGVFRERRREAGWGLYQSVGIARGDREASARQAAENFRLFGAPHAVIITTTRSLGVYGAIDTGGYIANLMLAAQSHGLGTIAQGALAVYGRFIHEYFDIPQDEAIVCGMSLGFPDHEHPANGFRTGRAELSDVVHWVED